MRNTALATLAVVGVAACIATFAFTSSPSAGQNLLSQDLDDLSFIQYVSKYQKAYITKEEFNYRWGIFSKALETIKAKNSQQGRTYVLGVNKFADWTKEEFRTMLGYKKVESAIS